MRLPCHRTALLAAILAAALLVPAPAQAAAGWWLDHFSATAFLLSGQLDRELAQMRQEGADTLLLQADRLPTPVLEWMAARAKAQQLQTVAWIQWPATENLQRAAQLKGFRAVQVDDHFFHKAPLPLGQLRRELGNRELWCSFQPDQLSTERRRLCDHVDVQLYRLNCPQIEHHAVRLRLACTQQALFGLGLKTFVFKWKNPEARLRTLWSHPVTQSLQGWLNHFAAKLSLKHS
jgi:hypothetical protein